MSQRLLPPSGDDDLADLLRRAAHDEAPPAARLAAVVALAGAGRTEADWAAQAAGLARAAGALGRRIVAEWVGGAATAAAFAPAFGVRGAGTGALHRLYRAEQCEIDLRLARQGDTWQLAGQLFGVESVLEIVLSGPHFEAAARPDATQAFAFPSVLAGSYSLTVKTGELDIVIPTIDVGLTDQA